MNLYHENINLDPSVLKSAGYDISRYIKFIDKSIELLTGQTLAIKVRKQSVLLEVNIDDRIEKTSEIRYYPVLPDNAKRDEIKNIEKAIKILFDENTRSILVKKQNEPYQVKISDRNESENYILLAREIDSEYISLQPDINQLKQQKLALFTLIGKPLKEHLPLLNLFGSPSSSIWNQDYFKDDLDWKILTDETKDGVFEQREFVLKALHTNDFALLEGPPGSGKTTTIIELIVQFISEGKRILLCSATHAAIDNVIERITERYKEECADVVPLRISHFEKPVKENVRPYLHKYLCNTKRKEIAKFLKSQKVLSKSQEYLLKNISMGNVENNDPKMYKPDMIDQLILDSANLVTGTMIGILQHPDIKSKKSVASFDVLIVDEASKVTFADFIVPALHAKKWILVGDVKQLSPYVEDEYVSEYLKGLLSLEDQKSLVEQFELKNKLDDEKFNDSLKVYFTDNDLLIEKTALKSLDRSKELIFETIDNTWTPTESNLLKINSSDVLIAENSDKVLDILHKNIFFKSIYINLKEDSQLIYRQDYLRKGNNSKQPYFFNRDEDWCDLVANRLSQNFSFRNTEGFENLENELLNLIPSEIEPEISELKRLVFPSILELLQSGVGQNEGPKGSRIISNGFHKKHKESRFSALTYQHRMHPDIARTSKENFYKEYNNLLSANTVLIDRGWEYGINEPVVKWVHNTDKTWKKPFSKIVNLKEVEDIEYELSKFLNWAKENPKINKYGKIENYEVAILTFYLQQETELRKVIRKLTGQVCFSKFEKNNTNIFLYTVDKFQGQEADFVLLGFTKYSSYAHFNSPNRLNVALTRARHKMILFGNREWFIKWSKLKALRELATNYKSPKRY